MYRKDLKLKRVILWMVFLLSSVCGLCIFYFQYQNLLKEFEYDKKVQMKYFHKTYSLLLKELQYNISLQSEIILDNKKVLNAIKNKNRDLLYSLVEKNFEFLRKQNPYIKIMTFRTPDAITLLRVHKPQFYGDSLNTKRKILIDTLETKMQQIGFEVGKLKMSYRISTPIFLEEEFIGFVEIGIEPEYIINKLQSIFNLKTALLINEEALDITLDNKKDFKKVGDYYLARGDDLFKDNISLLDLKNNIISLEYYDNNYMIDTTLNLYDNKEKTTAKLLTAFSNENYKERLNDLIWYNFTIITIVCLVFIFIFNYVFKYFFNRLEESHKEIIQKDTLMIAQSKMALLGEMLENIAHQWKQPLSQISAQASSIKFFKDNDMLDDDSVEKGMTNILKYVDYMAQTMNDFKDFFKSNKKEQSFKAQELLDRTLLIAKNKIIKSNIQLIEDIKDVSICGQENELIQVIINLFNNAADELIKKDYERLLFINIFQNDNQEIVIEVFDNAGGINKEYLDLIFESHFTTKEEGKGTGIGLYMSDMIIRNTYKGSICVNNHNFKYKDKEYVGAKFIIKIPLSKNNSN